MECPDCDGDGVVTFMPVDKIIRYVRDFFELLEVINCPTCNGTGEIDKGPTGSERG